MKLGDGDLFAYSHRLPQCLDALDLVHGLGSEIGFPTVGARPHGNAFNHEQRVAAAKAASDATQVNFSAPA